MPPHVLSDAHALLQQIALHAQPCFNVVAYMGTPAGRLPANSAKYSLVEWDFYKAECNCSVVGGYKPHEPIEQVTKRPQHLAFLVLSLCNYP